MVTRSESRINRNIMNIIGAQHYNTVFAKLGCARIKPGIS